MGKFLLGLQPVDVFLPVTHFRTDLCLLSGGCSEELSMDKCNFFVQVTTFPTVTNESQKSQSCHHLLLFFQKDQWDGFQLLATAHFDIITSFTSHCQFFHFSFMLLNLHCFLFFFYLSLYFFSLLCLLLGAED